MQEIQVDIEEHLDLKKKRVLMQQNSEGLMKM